MDKTTLVIGKGKTPIGESKGERYERIKAENDRLDQKLQRALQDLADSDQEIERLMNKPDTPSEARRLVDGLISEVEDFPEMLAKLEAIKAEIIKLEER